MLTMKAVPYALFDKMDRHIQTLATVDRRPTFLVAFHSAEVIRLLMWDFNFI